jgi:hypothetical protein
VLADAPQGRNILPFTTARLRCRNYPFDKTAAFAFALSGSLSIDHLSPAPVAFVIATTTCQLGLPSM